MVALFLLDNQDGLPIEGRLLVPVHREVGSRSLERSRKSSTASAIHDRVGDAEQQRHVLNPPTLRSSSGEPA